MAAPNPHSAAPGPEVTSRVVGHGLVRGSVLTVLLPVHRSPCPLHLAVGASGLTPGTPCSFPLSVLHERLHCAQQPCASSQAPKGQVFQMFPCGSHRQRFPFCWVEGWLSEPELERDLVAGGVSLRWPVRSFRSQFLLLSFPQKLLNVSVRILLSSLA